MVDISERSLEETIERALLASGPDALPKAVVMVRERQPEYAEPWPLAPGGYRLRKPEEYDRGLCLIPRDVVDFVIATQPGMWQRLQEHYDAETKTRFLARLSKEVGDRGTLDVLRHGIKDTGCRFDLAYFRPSSTRNPDVQNLYSANVFAVVRQLKYSEKNANSLDLVLFLNGLPLFTAELKNHFTGQDIQQAKRQYKTDRDPKEPLFRFGRCLAHFAVDPELVAVTTKLEGPVTVFLPFNQGRFGGAGNPPVPPTRVAYATAYLWERIWARDSVLNLVQQFIHFVEEEDERGRKTGRKSLLFPRFHQLDCVRRLVAHAREYGTGQRYLVQHSAGSGKSNSIAWLAHQLSVLHDADDRRVFDSIIVVTDRRVLDRQLQRTVRQFEQTLGVVENIDQTGKQLKEALEAGKTIIVTTLQKFPVIADKVSELPSTRFALIVDEAHSSQSGESTKKLKQVLAAESLEQAETEDESAPEEDLEDRIIAEMRKRGRLPNVSTFAFTATPKAKTLELFGVKNAEGGYEPFSLYSMRQAIEEGFILDVLQNYTTLKVYWNLLKKIEDDPHYERDKASYLLQSFVGLHEHAIRKKVEIMVEHFQQQVAGRIGGRAKAMVVTRSRLHAVRYRLEFDRYLRERQYPYKALVAFSGEVRDGGVGHTEAGMNGLGEAQTAKTFHKPEFRFLIVANKFQTGFDEPLLHTMYVDKKLGGVQAVQTLSRLNRTAPKKSDTMVLDFANTADEIQKAFEPYYERTILSEGTDPNLLYSLERDLLNADVFTKPEVDGVARLFFAGDTVQEQLYAAIAPCVDRFAALNEQDQTTFRSRLTDYIRLYAFLSQIVTFADADLEKLYVFARLLRQRIPPRKGDLPLSVTEAIDMASYRIEEKTSGHIKLERGVEPLDPLTGGAVFTRPQQMEPLSAIIRELNEKFGTDFRDEDKVVISQLEARLAAHESLADSIRVNTAENARLTFNSVVGNELQDLADTNFKFYKRVTDDEAFARHFLGWLFERVRAVVRQ